MRHARHAMYDVRRMTRDRNRQRAAIESNTRIDVCVVCGIADIRTRQVNIAGGNLGGLTVFGDRLCYLCFRWWVKLAIKYRGKSISPLHAYPSADWAQTVRTLAESAQ